MMLPFRCARKGPHRVAIILATVVVFLLTTLWLNPNWTDRSVHKVLRFDPTQLDLNVLDTRKELCGQYNWRPFHTKNQQSSRRVYDLFMVNTELDWLEIR